MLTIGIATFNREDKLLSVVHNLLPFIKQHDIELVIYNDGGSFELASKILTTIQETDEIFKSNIKITNNRQNKGVFHSKVSTMKMATREWYIHLDDDDYMDTATLLRLVNKIKETKGEIEYSNIDATMYPAVQFNVSRLYYNWKNNIPKYFTRFDWIRKSYRSENAMTLVGMLFHLPSIKAKLKSYFNDPISTWKSTTHGFGDDVFIAGYLLQDYPREMINYCDLVLQYQKYNDEDYHISTDNEIPRRVNNETKPYLTHSKLKKVKLDIDLMLPSNP